MVATGHPLAAQAAARLLREGGSAVDAAIAADAVMGVVEPMATGIGGDLLAMLVMPDGTPHSYNGSGRSPMAFGASLLSGLPNQRLPERHVLTATVPGAVRGWRDLHNRHGVAPWASLFADAIAVARSGFAVSPVAAREWALFQPVIAADEESARLYRAHAVPRAGELFSNPELADTLTDIANAGPDAFYLGRAARAAEAACSRLGGVLMASDFAAHQGEFTVPVRARFRDLEVLECPPNTHGVAVLHALQALDAMALDPRDPATTVAMVDSMDAAMAHAKRVVADPAGNTVCTVVVDARGLAVTLMSSVFKRFGSGIGVPGCGFALQNRGFGFAPPGQLNGAAPGKRPYHTVVPGAALRNGRFHAGFGVVGGAMQPQGHVQLMVRTAAWGQALQAAIDAPRWRLEGNRLLATEAGTPADVERALRNAGYAEPSGEGELGGRSDFGGAQVVMRNAHGELIGGSDRRKDGMALAC
ncbi:MAG: gamma-glutamyltransferase [Hydrogenophaga sp.]|nr:gamma-glutamyltransferase [Hydrogenophaga sp.]